MSGIDPTARLCGNCVSFPNCASFATPDMDPTTLHCPTFVMASAADKVSQSISPELPPPPPEVPMPVTPTVPETPSFELPPMPPAPSEMGGVTMPEPVQEVPDFAMPVQETPIPAPEPVSIPDPTPIPEPVLGPVPVSGPASRPEPPVAPEPVQEKRNEAFNLYDRIQGGEDISEFADDILGESIDDLKRARRAEQDKNKKKEFTEAIRFFENELADRISRNEPDVTETAHSGPDATETLHNEEICNVHKAVKESAPDTHPKKMVEVAINKLLQDLTELETRTAYADPGEILDTVARLVSIRNELNED